MTLHSATAATAATAGLIAPVTVAEIELGDPVTVNHISVAEADHDCPRQALVLVRLQSRPLTTIVVDAPGGVVDTKSCAAAAWAALDGDIPSPGLDRRPETAASGPAPSVTVVVATRERTGSLAACLDSLACLDYPDYEVVIVDNDPVTGDTGELVRHRTEPNIRYTREDKRGLAAAHNRGLQLAEGDIVAFTDDDVLVDRHWLTEVSRGFAAVADVGCVTGLILSAELRTPAQVLQDAHFGFGKGFRQRVVGLGPYRPADPLFPFTAGRLGSGANMSFDRDMLRELGGFDPAIGTGTVARGGDDLAAFFAVIMSGRRLVYQPGALVWHRNRPDSASLPGQAYAYGVGLGAYLASALTHHPASIGQALYRAPMGLAHALRTTSSHAAHPGNAWPRRLTRLQRRGLAAGPLAYGLSRWRGREILRPHADREQPRGDGTC